MGYSLSDYDFLDIGCGDGHTMIIGRAQFLGERGLGIDKDEASVAKAKDAGHNALVADALTFDPAPHRFDFLTAYHILEHLPSLESVASLIARMPMLARHFAFVAIPSFEGEDYLKQLGLRQYWTNWVGHPCHITVNDLVDALAACGLAEFEMRCVDLVLSSSHPSIVPVGAQDELEYDPSKHGPKPSLPLRQKVFREVQALVRMPGGDLSRWNTARRCFFFSEDAAACHLVRLEAQLATARQELDAVVGSTAYRFGTFFSKKIARLKRRGR